MGRTFERITEVEYDIEEEKKHIYGRGKKPKGVQPGRQKPTAGLTIGQSEFEAMIREAQKVSKNAKASDLVFDIHVHYLLGTDIVKDKIVQFTPMNNPKALKEGDGEMVVKLKGICQDIIYNAD